MSCFIETTEGLFESLLADTELASDDFGGAVVIEEQATTVTFECVEDVIGEGGDALVAGGIEAEVDLTVGMDRLDEGFEGLTDIESDGLAIGEDEPEVLTFDQCVVAEGTTVRDQHLDSFARSVERGGAAEMAIEPHGGHDPVGGGIEVDEHENLVTDAERKGLFAERKEQIFGEAPVEERADLAVEPDDFQGYEIAHGAERCFGGGNEAIFGIAIDKNIESSAEQDIARDVAAGEEDFAVFARVEVDTGRGISDDAQGVKLSDCCHW